MTRAGQRDRLEWLCHYALRPPLANFVFKASVEATHLSTGLCPKVEYKVGDSIQTIKADYVWSTIPVTILAERIQPIAPQEVLESAKRIRFRGMILIYLVITFESKEEIICTPPTYDLVRYSP